MKPQSAFFLIVTIVLAFGSSLWGQNEAQNSSKTVQEIYPGLTSGALSMAVLKDLPEGILLRAGSTEMTSESISKIIDSQPEQGREELRKNAFFILEQEAAGRILLEIAKKAMPPSMVEALKEDQAIIQQFFEQEVFKKIEVADQELKTFYENNKELCGGASFEQVGPLLKEYLISQKKQEIAASYIQNLGRQMPIQVSKDWVANQAVLAFDNPVDKARKSRKPSLVDFGASGCKPCDMMAPILETLKKKYEGKVNVLFIDVRQ